MLRRKYISTRQLELKHLEGVQATIASFNHDINNALTIAMGYLRKLSATTPDKQKALDLVEKNLQKIRTFTKKMQELDQAEVVEYSGGVSMLDIDKTKKVS